MRNFVITLLLGAAIGFGCAKTIDQPVVANTSIIVADQIKEGVQFGIAHLPVAEGTDMTAYEKYLREDYLKKWNQVWEKTGSGVRGYLLKGVAGEHDNTFGFILVKPDQETDAKYFPDGNASKELERLRAEVGVPWWPEYEGFEGQIGLGDQLVLTD